MASIAIRQRRGFTLIELMIVVAIIGILAAIAIPNFIKFQARSKQAEARANLKALFTAQNSYFQEHDHYSVVTGELGFQPERGNRYFYQLAPGTPEPRDSATIPAAPPGGYQSIAVDTFKYPLLPDGVTNTPPSPAAAITLPHPTGLYQVAGKYHFLHSAVGNIDNDTAATGFDEWFIGSESLTVAVSPCTDPDSAEQVSGGIPGNSNNDVNCE